ncbi:MAG: MucR family transcriptional regulator [Parvibaculaceae bacterium]
MQVTDRNSLVVMARDIVIAEISHYAVPPEALPGLIERVYDSLQRIALREARLAAPQGGEAEPAATGKPSRPTGAMLASASDEKAEERHDLEEAEAMWVGQAEMASPPQAVTAQAEGRAPAVPPETSVHPDYIVCLFDGVRRKMLKRHIKTRYGMNPEEYRRYWDLPDDYPMTAPAYSEEKRNYAVMTGFGLGDRRRMRRGAG